jgi:hypothetical protein
MQIVIIAMAAVVTPSIVRVRFHNTHGRSKVVEGCCGLGYWGRPKAAMAMLLRSD